MAKPSISSSSPPTDDLAKVFARFDADGDGRISPEELAGMLTALGSKASSQEVGEMIDAMDSDRDGFVNLEEFVTFYTGGGGSAAEAEAELRDAFKMYDLDQNGKISAHELHQVLRMLGEHCSVKDCSRMIKSVDADGDGSVSFEEFKKMMNGGAAASGRRSEAEDVPSISEN